jgi:hypothetical protein
MDEYLTSAMKEAGFGEVTNPDKTKKKRTAAVYILDLVNGDREVEKIVLQIGNKEETPSLIFSWNDENLALFWAKAAAYNAVASADAQKEVANHPLPAQPTLTQLKTGF